MTCSSMTMSLPGYERNTCIKIKYEVPNGIQTVSKKHHTLFWLIFLHGVYVVDANPSKAEKDW